MSIKKIVAALAVAGTVASVAAPMASADIPPRAEWVEAQQFATNYWENWLGVRNTCRGYGIAVRFEQMPTSTFGYTYLGMCRIHLNSAIRWNWWNLCEVVTHETGHALGFGHSRQPSSIMNPRYPNPVWGYRFPACVPAG